MRASKAVKDDLSSFGDFSTPTVDLMPGKAVSDPVYSG